MNFTAFMDQVIDATEDAAAEGMRQVSVCVGLETIHEMRMQTHWWDTYDIKPGEYLLPTQLLGYPVIVIPGIPEGEVVISCHPAIRFLPFPYLGTS